MNIATTTTGAMMPAPAPDLDARTLETVLMDGDLSRLTPQQRMSYYLKICDDLGVNPRTRPFQYIVLNGKLTLYALKACTDQLRTNRAISIEITDAKQVGDLFVVTCKASDPSGRTDGATGAVAVGSLKGEALANAMMKAETKAKRRATLSIVGLGWSDESEVDSIKGARKVEVNDKGEIVGDAAALDVGHAPTEPAPPPEIGGRIAEMVQQGFEYMEAIGVTVSIQKGSDGAGGEVTIEAPLAVKERKRRFLKWVERGASDEQIAAKLDDLRRELHEHRARPRP